MHRLWPEPPEGRPSGPLTDADLEEIYGYPDPVTRPWVQANFVSSADGAVSVADRSAGLSHPADKRIFALGRDLADVILVGAGTVRAERYRGAKPGELRVERRRRLGLADVPPIAVVSGRCTLDPGDPLFTDTLVPPIVLTTESAPKDRRAGLAAAGAEVLTAGEHSVDLKAALGALGERGLLRVNCEGGPHLFATLVAEDLVDQLCLTIAPLLAGAGADRIVAGRATEAPRRLRLASVLHEDGFTMFRYRRESGG
ncbi:riboflavin biosynthesis pyrimidine reductase [Prauserella shujinwangii]|uniref:Riboflavin biosynthesis pyrimidine reductase n=1 Tax=Prauserella shujinwangii TaxID=1453103 RepID=A0A2T0M3Q7_9PSEU|nr:pyrimidine reductase family protein [Prauserella shujinwangii]PRX51339.1 riboflavin biosynthesis pyrimidine reductase [Prauserella shujinwangii]